MTQGIKNGEPDARIVYADIIDLPRWQSPTRTPMSAYERAAQFSSFNALAGYEEMVEEEAREVGAEIQLSEIEMDELNFKFNLLSNMIEDGKKPAVVITYFVPDEKKCGGKYVTSEEKIRTIDTINRRIELCRKFGVSGRYLHIEMDRVREINL